jgi:type IV pilus assembly protein PilM
VGVDFNPRVTRLLQLRLHRGDLGVIGAGRVEMTRDGAAEVSGEALTERLRAAFASGGFTGRRCVVSLPRHVVQVQAVRLPRMPDAELAQAAAWEAAQRFGFEREQTQADFIRTGAPAKAGDAREEVLLIATTRDAISRYLEPLMAAGLHPVALDTDFSALARVFGRHYRRAVDREQVRAIVDVGSSGSTLLILQGDEIVFCKAISIGGDHLDQAVAEHLQLAPSAASELRAARIAEIGRADAGPPEADAATQRAIFEAVRPLIGDLIKEVTLCLRYYGVTFRGAPPARLILAGSSSLEPRLSEMLEAGCKLPVVMDDPRSSVGDLAPQIESLLHRNPGPGACWAVAAGLSLRGLSRARSVRRDDDAPAESRAAA